MIGNTEQMSALCHHSFHSNQQHHFKYLCLKTKKQNKKSRTRKKGSDGKDGINWLDIFACKFVKSDELQYNTRNEQVHKYLRYLKGWRRI